jgi:hypothetical protein
LHKEDPFNDKTLSRTRAFTNGHVALDFRLQRLPHAEGYIEDFNKTEWGKKYVKDMISAYGIEGAKMRIAQQGDPHIGIFPNLQLIHNQIRVVIPLAVNLTEVHMYPVFLEGVPDELNTNRLRAHESFYGPASEGSPDDAEIFERTQRGLESDRNSWVLLSRGLGKEQVDADGTLMECISDELTQRAQLLEWSRLMKEGD